MQPSCEAFEQNGTLARYVAGTASKDEAHTFEEHFVDCDECFEALVLASGVRAILREPVASVVPLRARRRGRFYGLIAAIGMAAAISGVLIDRNLSLSRVEALGAIDTAPAYGGVAVRAGDDTNAETQFESGMAAYAAGRYQEAAQLLQSALQAGLEPLPAFFFLGASYLKIDDARAAASSFERVVAEGDSPYTAEAHYYLAKAFLRLRRRDEALTHLNAAANTSDPIAPRARALADSVQEVSSRFFSRF